MKHNIVDKNHIAFLGMSGFPFGLAEIQRAILLSKALILKDYTVTFICTRGSLNKDIYNNIQSKVYYQRLFNMEEKVFQKLYLKVRGIHNIKKLDKKLESREVFRKIK